MANFLVVTFLLTAVATGTDSHFMPGERYALVAFIRAETREQAEKLLPEKLTENGWRDWSVLKSGLASPESESDEGVKLARKNGASITVFSEPTTVK